MAIIRDLPDRQQRPKTYRDLVKEHQCKSEAEIATQVMESLGAEGWDCYPEVAVGKLMPYAEQKAIGGSFGQSVCDIVAVKGRLAMMVECKKTYSLDLLEQALVWTRLAPLVVVAVPTMAINNRAPLKEHMRDYHGVGLFGANVSGVVYREAPRLLRHNLRHVDRLRGLLDPSMKCSTAGAALTWRQTPYQSTMSEIRCYLATHGPSTMREIYHHLAGETGGRPRHHYSSQASMQGCVSRSIRDGTEPDLRMVDGVVDWHPELCTKGTEYVANLQKTADYRKSLGRAECDSM
jgi:hypothetical protein